MLLDFLYKGDIVMKNNQLIVMNNISVILNDIATDNKIHIAKSLQIERLLEAMKHV